MQSERYSSSRSNAFAQDVSVAPTSSLFNNAFLPGNLNQDFLSFDNDFQFFSGSNLRESQGMLVPRH